jgi:hypothetical protein
MKSNRPKRTMTLSVGAFSLVLSAMTNAEEAKSIKPLAPPRSSSPTWG